MQSAVMRRRKLHDCHRFNHRKCCNFEMNLGGSLLFGVCRNLQISEISSIRESHIGHEISIGFFLGYSGRLQGLEILFVASALLYPLGQLRLQSAHLELNLATTPVMRSLYPHVYFYTRYWSYPGCYSPLSHYPYLTGNCAEPQLQHCNGVPTLLKVCVPCGSL